MVYFSMAKSLSKMMRVVHVFWICTMLPEIACQFHTGDVRLVDGSGDHEGRVEIFLNGQWGTVDDDPWDDNDAGVVCRQLGYLYGGMAYRSAHFGQGHGYIWLDDIQCVGNEPNLLSCRHGTDTYEDSHSEDVGVACYGVVRLVDGNGPGEGRVEIFMNGQWGTVDDDPWNDIDADVVCHQLGYPPGGAAHSAAYFGQGNGPIWLDAIQCTGNEPNLLRCRHGTNTSEDSHREDVGVTCAWPVRLVNGSLASQGRVEVLINGQWGTINDDDWNDRDATVVCTQLGYPTGGIAFSAAHFGEGTQTVINGNVECAGTETNLFRCPLHKIVTYNSHSQEAGVACFDLTIDPCDSHPCKHNGLCIREQNGYGCICPDGVEGSQCESETRKFNISLVLAICALLVVMICLVKIFQINRSIRHQKRSTQDDYVEMNVQPNENSHREGCASGSDKQRQGASSCSIGDEGPVAYETFNY